MVLRFAVPTIVACLPPRLFLRRPRGSRNGRHRLVTDLVGQDPKMPPVPVKVTVDWNFSAGGK
jgi:hypothetical protein